MATKVIGYVPTSVTKAIKKVQPGNKTYSNGTVTKNTGNLTSRGYSGSIGVNNASTKGYSSSRTPSTGAANVATTKVSAPATTSYSSSSSYSSPSYSYDDDYDYDSGSSAKASSGSDYDYSYWQQQLDAANAANQETINKLENMLKAAEEQRAKEEAQRAASYNALMVAYNKQKADYDNYLAQRKQEAQNAYDRGVNTLNSSYNNQLKSLGNNLTETNNQLLNAYNQSRSSISADAEDALRQAYINNMLNQKNLSQQLSAMGLNGGATETTISGMLNNYGNARNNIDTTRNKNLSSLQSNYNNNVSQAKQAYNTALANAESQKTNQLNALSDALSKNQIAALTDYQSLMQNDNQAYLNMLQNAIANGTNFTYDPTSADNVVRAVSYRQASPDNESSNYNALQALIDAQAGNVPNNNFLSLSDPTTQSNYLARILAQLRG
jgi:hypothetical protein